MTGIPIGQVRNPAPVSLLDHSSGSSCLTHMDKFKGIYTKLHRTTFTSEKELVALQENTEILRRTFRQARLGMFKAGPDSFESFRLRAARKVYFA